MTSGDGSLLRAHGPRDKVFEFSHIYQIKNANNSIEINISEMDVDFLDTDNIEEKLKVKLPVNGDTLQLKLFHLEII